VPDIDAAITLSGAGDVVQRRIRLCNAIFGQSTLPSTLPTVTNNVTDPYSGSLSDMASVDNYHVAMSNGQTNDSNLYHSNVSNGRLMILCPGHQGTCTWPSFASGYRMTPVLQALLTAGYDVLAYNQPGCGDSTVHNALFNSYGLTGMRYFIEPAIAAMNYWDAHSSYTNYNFSGLSGGGWTAAILPAYDTRVKNSIAVAGSMPGVMQYLAAQGFSDLEESYAPYYAIASYIDHYLMAAQGAGRKHVQILNYSDSSSFGNAQWVGTWGGYSTNYQAIYHLDWGSYLNNYAKQIQAVSAAFAPMSYQLIVDYIANQHQISPFAQSVILGILAGN